MAREGSGVYQADRGGMAARRKTIPLGPFLSLGGLIVLFTPHVVGLSSV